MPAAIAAAIIKFVGATGLLASVIKAAVLIGFSAATNAVLGAVFSADRGKPSDGQLIVRGSVQSRRRSYGIVHTGGLESFKDSSGGRLGIVVTLGTGEESDILEHRINDQVVTLDGSGVVTQASYHGAVRIYTRSGNDGQAAIAHLTAAFPQWTASHRQRGCAHAAIICDPVKQELFSEVFNGREPAYTQVRKAVKVYDPRLDSTFPGGSGPQRLGNKATWAWNDNAALVIADYMAHPDGYGLGYDAINWANIAEEAAICDQTVTTVTAAEIKRWRLWASYELAKEERRQVLADMLQAVDGFCWQGADFKFNLSVGRYEAPTLTLTDDHILAMTTRRGPNAQQRVSALKVLYTEAAIGYREQESATVAVPGADEDPNTDPQSVKLYYAPHHNQAVRVGKLLAARLSDRWRIEATLNLFGLNLLGRRFVRLISAEAAIDAVFMIDGGVKIQPGRDRMTIGVSLVEVAAADWAFDAASEEGTPPASAAGGAPTITVPNATGLALSAVQIGTSTGSAVAIEASWASPRADLRFEVRYRPTAGGTWVMMAVDNDALTARSGAVDSGVPFEVQIRSVTVFSRFGAWSASVTITPVATAALSAPSSLAATGGVGSASITFRMPPEPSLAYARVYGGASSSFGSAVQVGADIVGGLSQVMTITQSGLSPGTRYYWVRAFNGSGGSSALTGPVTATIT